MNQDNIVIKDHVGYLEKENHIISEFATMAFEGAKKSSDDEERNLLFVIAVGLADIVSRADKRLKKVKVAVRGNQERDNVDYQLSKTQEQ